MDDTFPSNLQGKENQAAETLSIATAPTSSSSSEDEDMANCLILLAQSSLPDAVIKETVEVEAEKLTSKGVVTNGKAEFYLYECKTCKKCFPSFRALGRHPTSHQKPKQLVQERKRGEIEKGLI